MPAPARTLVVGDVHGCSAELRRLLDLARPDRLLLLGDLYTKGPDPAGVWAIIQAWGAAAVLGNHDLAVLHRPGIVDLPPEALAWLAALPLTLRGEGPLGPWLAVHAGVDPVRGPDATDQHRAVVLRRWPDDADAGNPFWWELWRGPPLVLYGHDAVRGLVDRRPHSLGLDTGCVYGGALSGYLVEDDRVLQVPAERAWHPVSAPSADPR